MFAWVIMEKSHNYHLYICYNMHKYDDLCLNNKIEVNFYFYFNAILYVYVLYKTK